MKILNLLYRINLGLVLFLGAGWFYFYWLVLTKNIEKMPHAMTMNHTIFGLNVLFASSLILLPILYKKRK